MVLARLVLAMLLASAPIGPAVAGALYDPYTDGPPPIPPPPPPLPLPTYAPPKAGDYDFYRPTYPGAAVLPAPLTQSRAGKTPADCREVVRKVPVKDRHGVVRLETRTRFVCR